VILIAIGFVLRALAGAQAIEVEVSAWLVVCTFTLCLFLGFGKRRCEIATLENGNAKSHRATLEHYTPELLAHLLSVTGGLVYRGTDIGLQGKYLFGDFCSGEIFVADTQAGRADFQASELSPSTRMNIASFGEDEAGHCVLRVTVVPPALADQARAGEQNCPEGALSIED